jgi:hypothetical protein
LSGRPRTGRRVGASVAVGEPPGEVLQVEAQPAGGAAETYRAELGSVGVHPVTLNPQRSGYFNGVDVTHRRPLLESEEFDHPAGDSFDVIAIELHRDLKPDSRSTHRPRNDRPAARHWD